MIKKFKGLLSLFFWTSKLRISKNMAYRMDFFSGFFISIVYALIGPITQYLIFTQTKGYPGWTINQVLLFQGLLLLFTGIRNMFFGDIRSIMTDIVRKGDFDRYLLKPYPPIGIILTGCFSFNNIGTVLSGFVITVYFMIKLHITLGLVSILLILVSFVFSMILYMALLIFFSSLIIIFVQNRTWEFLDVFIKYSEYPVQIYPKSLQVLFLLIVPFAVFVYFPAQILLSRLDLIALLGFVSCVILFILSNSFWNMFVKRYTSAGG